MTTTAARRLPLRYAPRVRPLEVYALGDFLDLDVETDPVIAEGILDLDGMLLIAGPTEVGKSYFVLQLALELASGAPFLGRWTVERPFKVLLVQAEIGRQRFQTRLRKLQRTYPTADHNLWVATSYSLRLDTDQGREQLSVFLDVHGIEVLILDPMRPFHEGDENSSQDMERFFGQLKLQQEEWGIAVIITHHERKASQDGWGGVNSKGKQDARGSSLITDRPDTVLRLSKKGEAVTVTFEKLRNAEEVAKPSPVELVVDMASGLFKPVSGDAQASALNSGEVLHLVEQQNPWELGELVDAMSSGWNVAKKTAERKLNSMETEGLVEKSRDPNNQTKKLVRVAKEEGQGQGIIDPT